MEELKLRKEKISITSTTVQDAKESEQVMLQRLELERNIEKRRSQDDRRVHEIILRQEEEIMASRTEEVDRAYKKLLREVRTCQSGEVDIRFTKHSIDRIFQRGISVNEVVRGSEDITVVKSENVVITTWRN